VVPCYTPLLIAGTVIAYMKLSSKFINILFVLFGSVILCYIGLVNLYPLVYPDTGTYLHSGFSGEVPNDRTIFYGLFARHISLSSSPWYIIFVQGLFMSYFIYRTFSLFFSGNTRNFLFLTAITLLTLTTGLSYNVSILIPDIFPAISLFCLIHLLLNRKLRSVELAIISCIFVFSIATHLSNVPILFILLLILSWCYYRKRRKQETSTINGKRLVTCALLFAGTLLLIPSVNYIYDNKFQMSEGSHVFMLNHIRETGILEDYLDQACDEKDYKMCEFKDQLGGSFMWSYNSALYQTGGWAVNKDEYNSIMLDIVLTPKYFVMLSQKVVEYSFKQLFTFNISVAGPQLKGSAPLGQISWRFKDTLGEYFLSLQNRSKLKIDVRNTFQEIIVLCSMVFLFFILFTASQFQKLDPRIKWILVIVFIHTILSAIICSNVSTVDPRYINRIIWILPLMSFIIMSVRLEKNELIRKWFDLKDKPTD